MESIDIGVFLSHALFMNLREVTSTIFKLLFYSLFPILIFLIGIFLYTTILCFFMCAIGFVMFGENPSFRLAYRNYKGKY